MATIGSLVAELSANTAAFNADLGKARAALGSFTASANRSLATVDKSFAMVSRAASSFGLALGAGAAVSFVKSTIDTVGALGEQAEQLGISTDALQEYQAMALQSGVKAEQMDAAIAKLSRTIGDAAEGSDMAIRAFDRLGVGILDAGGNLRSTEAVTRDIADAIAKIEDPARRAQAMFDLFGRSGQKLLPILSQGAAGMDAMAEAARRSGLVVDRELIKRFDTVSDRVAVLGKQIVVFSAETLDTLGQAMSNTTVQGAIPFYNTFRNIADLWAWFNKQTEPPPVFTMKLPPLDGGETHNPASNKDVETAAKKAEAIQKVVDKLMLERDQLDRTALGQKFYTELKAAGIDVNHQAAGTIYDLVVALDREGAAHEDARRAGENHQQTLDTLGRQAQRVYDDTRTPLEQYNTKLDELNELLAEGLITQDTWTRGMKRAADTMHQAEDKLSGMKDAGRDFAHVIGTAFEDSIVQGKGLRDVMQGLLDDISRIILRVGVTKPFENALTNLLDSRGGSGGGLLSIFGGGSGSSSSIAPGDDDWLTSIFKGAGGLFGFAEGGAFRVGGGGGQDSQFVGFMASPDETVEVKTPAQRRGGAGSTSGDTYYIDARGADREGFARLEAMIVALNGSLERRAVAGVMDFKRRQPNAFAS